MDFILALLCFTFIICSLWIAAVLLLDSDVATFFYSLHGKPLGTLKDKVVWITGASSGIGEAVAKELASHGAKLVISARRTEELDRVKRECLAIAMGNLKADDILVMALDMTDYTTHQHSFQKVLDHFGKLDILISNAGRSQRADWENIEPEVDMDLFNLNVFSLLSLSRIVLKHFYEINKGHLAVMSSVAGKNGIPFSASYTGSKYALHGYFECLRNEIAAKHKEVKVTILCPGPVFSAFLKESFTANKGQKFGQDVHPTDKRMTAKRCATLCLVAIANELEESWMSLFPFLQLTYLTHYQPYLAGKLWRWLSASGRIMKFRDSRESMKKET